MARYGTLKRNIKRNINPWDDDSATKAKGDTALASKVIALFVALSIAGALVPLAANVFFRIPDIYDFDLGRTQSSAEISDSLSDKNIADGVSAFMMHKTDDFQVEWKVGDEVYTLFTPGDGEIMGKLRSFLDNVLVIGVTSLVVFLVLCVMFVRWNRPRELRAGFRGGFVLYGVMVVFTAFTIVFEGPAMKIWTDVIGVRFAAGDVMPRLFNGGFFLTAWIVVTLITLILMFILLSVINRFVKSELMFRYGKRRK